MDARGLCVSIFIKYTGWYLGVMVKLHSDKCLIYILAGEVIYGVPKIYTNSQCKCWFKN